MEHNAPSVIGLFLDFTTTLQLEKRNSTVYDSTNICVIVFMLHRERLHVISPLFTQGSHIENQVSFSSEPCIMYYPSLEDKTYFKANLENIEDLMGF